jgi:putative flippase GtrA
VKFLSFLLHKPETQLEKFAFAGTVGFVVEALLLSLFSHWWGVGPFLARIPAFLLTFLALWAIKRFYIFEKSTLPVRQSLTRYAYASLAGIILNWTVYSLAVHFSAFLAFFPPLALLIATTITSPLNFLIAKYGVFRASLD